VVFAWRSADAAHEVRDHAVNPTLVVAASSSGTPSTAAAKAAAETPPPPPAPKLDPATDVAEQAGVEGTKAYASRGVLELGGFANFSGASNFTSIQLSPTAGMFIFDSFEVSAILGFNYVHQTIGPNTPAERSDHKTIVRVLAEPSYHLPFSRTIWGFLGVGLGVATVPRGGGGTSAGFDLAPRAGANFLVGRSGLLTPAVFVDYTTGESIETNGGNILGANTTYGVQAGYTAMW
jgi:hypothetical protein